MVYMVVKLTDAKETITYTNVFHVRCDGYWFYLDLAHGETVQYSSRSWVVSIQVD